MRLEVQYPNGIKEVFETFDREVIIGRGSKANLRIKSQEISREHCIIRVKSGTLYIKDLGSSNGTYIGEDKLKTGEEVEWQTFFAISIGAGITIAFLPEKDMPFAFDKKKLNDSEITKTKKINTNSKELELDIEKDKPRSKDEVILNQPKEKEDSIYKVLAPFILLAFAIAIYFFYPELFPF